jgi:hypothetical protein
MSSPQSDKNFGGSIAKFYDEYFVPLIFESYAEDIQGVWLRAGLPGYSRSPPAPASSPVALHLQKQKVPNKRYRSRIVSGVKGARLERNNRGQTTVSDSNFNTCIFAALV